MASMKEMDDIVALDTSPELFKGPLIEPAGKDRRLLELAARGAKDWIRHPASTAGKWVTAEASELLPETQRNHSRAPRRKPFFAVISLNDMHLPRPICRNQEPCTNREMYSFVEPQILALVKTVLKASSNTVILVASDHGEKTPEPAKSLQDPDFFRKKPFARLLEPDVYALRTPLFIRMPTGAYPSKTSMRTLALNAQGTNLPVTNLDIFATITTLIGIDHALLPSMNNTIRGQVRSRTCSTSAVCMLISTPYLTRLTSLLSFRWTCSRYWIQSVSGVSHLASWDPQSPNRWGKLPFWLTRLTPPSFTWDRKEASQKVWVAIKSWRHSTWWGRTSHLRRTCSRSYPQSWKRAIGLAGQIFARQTESYGLKSLSERESQCRTCATCMARRTLYAV